MIAFTPIADAGLLLNGQVASQNSAFTAGGNVLKVASATINTGLGTYIKIGETTQTATADDFLLPSGTHTFISISPSDDNIGYIRQAGTNTFIDITPGYLSQAKMKTNFTPLADSTVALIAGGASQNATFTAGGNALKVTGLSVGNNIGAYIRLGTTTQTATAADIFVGSEEVFFLCIPPDYDNIGYLQAGGGFTLVVTPGYIGT